MSLTYTTHHILPIPMPLCPCALLITLMLLFCIFQHHAFTIMIYHSNNRFPLFVLFIFCTSDVVIYYFNNLQCEENKRLFNILFIKMERRYRPGFLQIILFSQFQSSFLVEYCLPFHKKSSLLSTTPAKKLDQHLGICISNIIIVFVLVQKWSILT